MGEGSCVVSPGLILGKRSTALINSVLTKVTETNRSYEGSPAKLMENVNFYIPISLEEKFRFMLNWLNQFVEINYNVLIKHEINEIVLFDKVNLNEVIFTNEKI